MEQYSGSVKKPGKENVFGLKGTVSPDTGFYVLGPLMVIKKIFLHLYMVFKQKCGMLL
jgi:hypothetical protein